MLSKKLLVTFIAFLVLAGAGSAAFAASQSYASQPGSEFGNLTNVLLGGGYSADYADGMILFSDPDDNGNLWLENVRSGDKRQIEDKPASFINVIGNDIYFVSSDSDLFFIIKTNLRSDSEILVSSETEISNLFVSEECMYYLCNGSVVKYTFSDEASQCILSNPQIKAFVPENGDIYWLKEKPAMSQSRKSYAYEGTEEENINYDCYLYSSENGTNTVANLSQAISKESVTDYSGLDSLALSVEVGGVKIPTEEYPVGSYFTDSGMPCSDHGTGVCGWESEELCNCKAFHNGVSLNAVQCYGYARYIYYSCFDDIGMSDSKNSSNIGSLEKGTVTEEAFKALIQQTKPGAHLRVQYIKANGYSVSTHSMVILDWNESGFSVCEANADGKCGVSVRKFDYSSFVSTLVSVNFLMMPDDYPGFIEETTAQPVATPGDATSSTVETEEQTQTVPEANTGSTAAEATTEPSTSGQLLDDDDITFIMDILSFMIQIFTDCVNAVIRIVTSII